MKKKDSKLSRKKLCYVCRDLLRREDTENKRAYRLKVKEIKSKPEQIKINHK